MGIPLFENKALQSRDFFTPDGDGVIWPIPHDAKLDMQRILRVGLDALGLLDVVVSKTGAFTQAQLQDEKNASVPYITVQRTGDAEMPMGLGQMIAQMGKGDPKLVDQGRVNVEDDLAEDGGSSIPEGGTAVIHGTGSSVTVSITVSDKNPYRADQMYIIVKLMLVAAQEEFRRIGYIKFRRTAGEDAQDLVINGTSPFVVFNRTLHYELEHLDLIATIEEAVNLVKQTLNFNEADPSYSITTDL